MIFLSFAADFSFSRAVEHLFAIGTKNHSKQLKSALADRYQGTEVRLFHNGRTALATAIRYLVPKDSKIVINGLTCYAVPQAVKSADCHPVYADINNKDFNFDIKKLTETLEKDSKIKAIIIQNHLGLTANIKAIEKLAKKHNLIIIEDLAHCAGSHYADGREVGTVGSAAALSFGKGKAIDTTEGGALVFRDENIKLPDTAQIVPSFPNRFRDRFYPFFGWLIRSTYGSGFGKAFAAVAFKTRLMMRSAEGKVQSHLRLTHWQARLALAQVKNLDHIAKKRSKYSARYGFPETSSIIRIPFLVNNRDELLAKLRKKDIYLDDSWYQVPVAPERYYNKADFPEKTCPVAVEVSKTILNLPLLPKTHLKTAMEIIEPEIIKSGN